MWSICSTSVCLSCCKHGGNTLPQDPFLNHSAMQAPWKNMVYTGRKTSGRQGIPCTEAQEVWQCQKKGQEVAHKWEMMGFFNVMKFVSQGTSEVPPHPRPRNRRECVLGEGCSPFSSSHSKLPMLCNNLQPRSCRQSYWTQSHTQRPLK